MKRLILVLAILLLLPAYTLAQQVPKEKGPLYQISKCSSFEGGMDRLECYDSLTRTLGVNNPRSLNQEIKGAGKWEISMKEVKQSLI